MNDNKIPRKLVLILSAGEFIAGALICLIFFFAGKFDYRVALGALLGSAVTVLNFLFLCIFVNRAIDNCLNNFDASKLRCGTDQSLAETDDEKDSNGIDEENEENEENEEDDAARFARENAGKLQNAVKLSYVLRTGAVIAALILALLTKHFNVIATVIPLLLQRPILTVAASIGRKEAKG